MTDPVKQDGLAIGLDIGSTTCKAVVVDCATRRVIWSRYERHEARQTETVLDLLVDIESAFSLPGDPGYRVCATGSGAGPLLEPLAAAFIQEANALALAAEGLHPDVGSIIELGGQDAKFILFQRDAQGAPRCALMSMNDRCASGTGATIDRCLLRLGLSAEQSADTESFGASLHRVAAKCGVFAETDIVNLLRGGVPVGEILGSLGDAIVLQNLSVLLRGEVPRPKVLLLGGPNAFFPWLRARWRERIRALWDERGCDYPREHPLDELISVPHGAVYYAAYGAVLHGLRATGHDAGYGSSRTIREWLSRRGALTVRPGTGPPLIQSRTELEEFRRRYRIPPFQPRKLPFGKTVRSFIGIDGGSTTVKAVVLGIDGAPLLKAYRMSEGSPLDDTRAVLEELVGQAAVQGCRLEVLGLGVTGYAGDLLEEALEADVHPVETVAHLLAARHFFPEADVLCDIGGHDIKIIVLQNGQVKDFRLSSQCSAGNGMLLQAMAKQFGVALEDYAEVAFEADLTPNLNSGCAVFLDADRVNLQREGYSREQLLAGLATVLPKNVWQHVFQVPRLAELGRVFVLQGGTQHNLAAVKAQVDYIRARVPDACIVVHPHAGEAGALGAALAAAQAVRENGARRSLSLDAIIRMEHRTYQDASTECALCHNRCPRTFVDIVRDGRQTRFVAGAGCEDGMVDSRETRRGLRHSLRELRLKYPNLVAVEAELAFSPRYEPRELPGSGEIIKESRLHWSFWGWGPARETIQRRPFSRSSEATAERRREIRIGMPRALAMYDLAPWLLAYFETLGVPRRNLVFSDASRAEMWREGCHYGSIDPCFPAKLAQAHVYELLMDTRAQSTLDYIFFPSVTHLPTWIDPVMDSAACPVSAGMPKVVRAAFLKERDLFAARGVEYVDEAIQFVEPSYLRKQMFEIWGDRLGITRDESDFACEEGWRALERFDQEMQRRGRAILQAASEQGSMAILALCRPYHHDPGVHHGIFDQIQAMGYPILTVRSLPRDAPSLDRVFGRDLAKGATASAVDVRDVWPENYSTHSAKKVWAAKYAARHRHLAVLDLSSFKCGNDAPTYGVVDSIIRAARSPHAVMHDLDANKPRTSIKLRLRTFAYVLERCLESRRHHNRKNAEAKQSDTVTADPYRRLDDGAASTASL